MGVWIGRGARAIGFLKNKTLSFALPVGITREKGCVMRCHSCCIATRPSFWMVQKGL